MFAKKGFSPVLNKKWNNRDRLFYIILLFFGTLFVLKLGIWWFKPNHIPDNFQGVLHIIDYIIFGLLTYVVGYRLLYELFFWLVVGKVKTPHYLPPNPNLKVAFLTAFVPGNEPVTMLEKTLKAMKNNSYPHDTWVLDEGNDPKVRDLCKKLGVLHFSRKGKKVFNQNDGAFKTKTKAGNYNSWLNAHADKYDFIAQLDVDFVPHKSFLSRTLGYFRDPNVGFVGTPQIYGNMKDNWIARGAAEQTYGFYGPIQKGMYGLGMTLFIGANHIVRIEAIKDIRGYAGHVTEDHYTGIKYYHRRWKSVYVPEILAVGEGPSSWDSFFNQQYRWAYGSLDIFFRIIHKYFWSNKSRLRLKHYLTYLILEHFYFAGAIQFIGICLLGFYFALGINAANVDIIEMLFYVFPVFLIQNVFYFWSQRFYIDPEFESGFGLAGKLLSISSLPVFLKAFLDVVRKKPLVYKVTTKGEAERASDNLALFYPHIVSGTITAVFVILSLVTKNQSLVMIFFAVTNSFFMFFFSFNALWNSLFVVGRREQNNESGRIYPAYAEELYDYVFAG